MQSSRFILPFSFLVIIALIGLLVFVHLSMTNGWFSPAQELIESLETVDSAVSYPNAEFTDFTISEVEAKNTKEECYVVIDDLVYVLSEDFLDQSKNDFFDETVCGQNITDAFKTQVDYTIEDLTKFLIGKIVLVKDN